MPCLFSDYPFLFFSHPGPPLAEISQPSAQVVTGVPCLLS